MYGDEWLNVLKNLEGDEEAILKARQQRKDEYNQRLASLLALKKLRALQEPEKLEDIEENEIIDSKKYEKFCVDWVKREMDEETWRKMNEQEKQKFLLVMVKNAPWRVLKDRSAFNKYR